MSQQAPHDEPTRLTDRAVLRDRLSERLVERRASGAFLGVLVGDLDGMKGINAQFGHEAGDEVLRIVARRLSATTREIDSVAHIGGDQFVIVCPELSSADDLETLAERLSKAVAQPAQVAGATTTPHISVGGTLTGHGDDADSALRRAKAAMERSKRRARHRARPGRLAA